MEHFKDGRLLNETKDTFYNAYAPPVHGAAMMGQYVYDSKLINEKFECHYINPSLSSSVANVGKVNIGKIFLW